MEAPGLRSIRPPLLFYLLALLLVTITACGGGDSGEAAGAESDATVIAPDGMTVSLVATEDGRQGFNLEVKAVGFSFTPQNINGDHVPGEGHAHLFLDGKRVDRLYGKWFHLRSRLSDGEHELRVALYANDLRQYVRDGEPVESVMEIKERKGNNTTAVSPVEAGPDVAVALAVEEDPRRGFNVRVDVAGFSFAPQSLGGTAVPGEGYAELFVDGTPVKRVYGPDVYLRRLEPGRRELRIELRDNTFAPLHRDGSPVQATATTDVTA